MFYIQVRYLKQNARTASKVNNITSESREALTVRSQYFPVIKQSISFTCSESHYALTLIMIFVKDWFLSCGSRYVLAEL